MKFTLTDIPMQAGLDAIKCVWIDYAPGQGEVIITCYGSAWTAYFGGMGGETIKQFILTAGVDYLLAKFGAPIRSNKMTKKEEKYLERILTAVKKHLKEEEVAA